MTHVLLFIFFFFCQSLRFLFYLRIFITTNIVMMRGKKGNRLVGKGRGSVKGRAFAQVIAPTSQARITPITKNITAYLPQTSLENVAATISPHLTSHEHATATASPPPTSNEHVPAATLSPLINPMLR